MKIKLNYVIIPAIAFCVVLTGNFLTRSFDAWVWYKTTLKLPIATPPDWFFHIAWNIIFILTTICALVVWNYFQRARTFLYMIDLFIANACLNVLWTYLFFVKRMIGLALIDAVALALVTLVLTVLIGQRSLKIAALLLPYLVWCGFAIYLNHQIWVMN